MTTTPPRKPARTILIPITAFSDTWLDRPTAPIAVGLRLLSEHHVTGARAEASKQAVASLADESGEVSDRTTLNEAFNDAFLGLIVAAAICDPNSLDAPHPLFPYAIDQVRGRFTTEGLLLVWHEVERLHHEASPLVAPIDAEGITELVTLLGAGALERQPRAVQTPTGRLLAHCLEVLREGVTANG